MSTSAGPVVPVVTSSVVVVPPATSTTIGGPTSAVVIGPAQKTNNPFPASWSPATSFPEMFPELRFIGPSTKVPDTSSKAAVIIGVIIGAVGFLVVAGIVYRHFALKREEREHERQVEEYNKSVAEEDRAAAEAKKASPRRGVAPRLGSDQTLGTSTPYGSSPVLGPSETWIPAQMPSRNLNPEGVPGEGGAFYYPDPQGDGAYHNPARSPASYNNLYTSPNIRGSLEDPRDAALYNQRSDSPDSFVRRGEYPIGYQAGAGSIHSSGGRQQQQPPRQTSPTTRAQAKRLSDLSAMSGGGGDYGYYVPPAHHEAPTRQSQASLGQGPEYRGDMRQINQTDSTLKSPR